MLFSDKSRMCFNISRLWHHLTSLSWMGAQWGCLLRWEAQRSSVSLSKITLTVVNTWVTPSFIPCMLTFQCSISRRTYSLPSVLVPHLTRTASVGLWSGCPCCRDNLTFTLPTLQPSGEWLLIKCSSSHPQSNLRPEVLSGGLPSSAELSALCYRADRGKWQCSSFPLNDSVLIQPVSTPEQSNRKKEGKNNQNRRANTYQLFGGIVTGGPFQKSPCHLFQGHTAILGSSLLGLPVIYATYFHLLYRGLSWSPVF